MKVQIQIDGKTTDLYSETDIDYTFQVNDIADIKDRQANFTDSFTIPQTPNNIQIFDGLSIPSDTSRIPYERPLCTIKNDGFDLVKKGWLNVSKSTNDYNINVYSGLVGFFKSLENKKLSDLPIILNQYKTIGDIVNSWTNPDQKYLLANYGGVTHFDRLGELIINADYLVPSIRLKYLFELIFEFIDYEYIGDIFDSEDFETIWITFPNGLIGTFYKELLFKDVLKEFTISQFIKEILVMFGLTIYPDDENRKVTFKTIDQRFRTSNVLDWSGKYIVRKEETYAYDTYGENNRFRYRYNNEDVQFHDGNLVINNKNLTNTKDVFTSKFYAAENEKSIYNLGSDSFLSNIFKLVEESKSNSGEVTFKELKNHFILIRAVERSGTIKIGSKKDSAVVPYDYTGTFYIGSFENLNYQYFVNNYYNGLYKVLNNSRIHKIDLNLNLIDVLNLDLSALYFFKKEQAYYILNKLQYSESKQSGEFVKVEKYTDYIPMVTSVSIKYRDFADFYLVGTDMTIFVEDLGVVNLGDRTITERTWVITNVDTSEYPYLTNIHDAQLEPESLNSIYLVVKLSDGTILYSNVLEYLNTLVSRCFTGLFPDDDPIHYPPGGTIVYVDAYGATQTISLISDTDTVKIYPVSITSLNNVVEMDCP